MKAKELITIIDSQSPEPVILAELKSKLAKIPNLSKMRPWKDRTPLEEAIIKGYTSIVKFFIEEKGVNPKEAKKVNIPLDFAIECGKTEIALYLISKMKGFPLDKYAIRLFFSIKTSQFTIVKAILDAEPQILTYSDPSLSFLETAVIESSEEIALLLLERSGKSMMFAPTQTKYSPYYASLHFARPRIIAAMLEAGASPIQCTSLDCKVPSVLAPDSGVVSEENLQKWLADLNMTPLQVVAKSTASILAKRESANVLLAAGAGLDANAIPSAILELYGLNSGLVASIDFIIIAEQKENNNQWKKKVFTKLSAVKECIADPNYRFNKEQLIKSCEHPDLVSRALPQIKELRNILSSNSSKSEETIPCVYQGMRAQPNSSWVPTKNIEQLNSNNLQFYTQKCVEHYLQHKEILFQGLNQLQAGNLEINIKSAFQNTFKIYSHLLEILTKNKHAMAICIPPFENLEIIVKNEFPVIEERVKVLLEALEQAGDMPHKNQIEIHIRSTFSAQCKFILRKHLAFLLRSIHNGLYNNLHTTKAAFELNLVKHYYETRNYSLALYYLVNVQRSLSQRNQFSNNLKNDLVMVQLQIHVWLAAVYHKQGCYKEATVELGKIKPLLEGRNELIVNCIKLISETMLQPIEIDMPSREDIAFYEALKRYVAMRPLELQDDKVNIVCNEFNQKLSFMKERYLTKMRSSFFDKMCIAGFLVYAPNAETLNLTLTQEEYATLSIETNELLQKTEGITYTPGVNNIDFNETFLLKNDIHQWINDFIKVLDNKPTVPATIQKTEKLAEVDSKETLSLTEKLSSLRFSKPKEKVKTRPQISSSSSQEEKHFNAKKMQPSIPQPSAQSEVNTATDKYGFTQLEGYSPAIPVVSNAIPNETLFLTIPINNPAFVPFLNLCYDRKTNTYHEIRSIAETGNNQQGVKLGSRWVTDPNQPPKQVDIARMKVLGVGGKGKLRAIGYSQQQITTDSRVRKLYVIDTLTDKKKEKHNKSFN